MTKLVNVIRNDAKGKRALLYSFMYAIKTLFVHNVSILYFDGPLSLIKQLIRIKLRPNLVRMIAQNAYETVQKSHTQLSRAKYLIKLVNNLH